jgi:hypothetical protein
MTAELIQRGVPVTENSPALVDDEMQFSNAFASAGSFSVALLAHLELAYHFGQKL